MRFFILYFVFCFIGYAQAEEIAIPKDVLKKVKLIKSDYQKASIPLKTKIKQKIEKIESLLASEASEEMLRKHFEELKQMRIDHQNMRFDNVLKMRRVLPQKYRRYIKMLKGKAQTDFSSSHE